ncbi:MAG: CCA tRNA nucleotidyltransferase [Phycisphaerae bacterium]|nr:CCA tRNA nucleotidyltransferase [Phycisphaerae bacterium]
MARPATKQTALWVIRRLRKAGFQGLLAGGCVRDMLLGRRSADYDVATDATPQQVRRLFDHVLLVGAKFGVAMVLHGGRRVEVTTFRSDLSYSDGRHPDGVRYGSPREDALRRDFTINGMFYDPLAESVIDHVGGRADLARRLVRTIGSPDERFDEDYLRMLRAVRFAVRLGFHLDDATAAAIERHAAKITVISGERIFDELCKMLSDRTAGDALAMLDRLRLARTVLGELFVGEPVWPVAVARVRAVARRRDASLALAALLLDMPLAAIRRIARRWGAPNRLRGELCWLADHRGGWRTAAEMPLCDLKRLMYHERFDDLRRLWRFEERRATGRQTKCRRIARRVNAIGPDRIAPPPLLTGDDLRQMGMQQGPRLGRVLKRVYDAQLDETIHTRADAERLAETLVAKP